MAVDRCHELLLFSSCSVAATQPTLYSGADEEGNDDCVSVSSEESAQSKDSILIEDSSDYSERCVSSDDSFEADVADSDDDEAGKPRFFIIDDDFNDA